MNNKTEAELRSEYSLWENTAFFCLSLCTQEYKNKKKHERGKEGTVATKKRQSCFAYAVLLWTERRVGKVRLKVVGNGRVIRVQIGLKHPLQQSIHGPITCRREGRERTETPGSPAGAASNGAAADMKKKIE